MIRGEQHQAPQYGRLARMYLQALEWLYQDAAWAYEAVAWGVSAGRWAAWRRGILHHLVGPRVLEIGSGPGALLTSLAEEGHQACGIDRSRAMVRLAAKRLRGAGVAAHVLCAAAGEMPFADGRFDSIACTFPAPFILAHETMTEAWRVLRVGGRLVILDGRFRYIGRGTDPRTKPSYAQSAETVGFQVTWNSTPDRHVHLELTIATKTKP